MYLITGGTGFLGQHLARRLISRGHKIRIMARNEGKLIDMKSKLPSVEIFPGDVADYGDCERAMLNIDGVFHLAAFKHIGMAERKPSRCFKTNLKGSENILNAGMHIVDFEEPVNFIIGISTDKAAQVNGVYGASKLIMEKMFEEYEDPYTRTKFRIVRYGNVIYSTGSVLCKWKDQIQKGETITITDPESTRFYWTREQAIDLIFDCLENAPDAKPWIPEMKSIKLKDLADAMFEKYASNGNQVFSYKEIGLQPGENKHERLKEGGPFSNEVEQYTTEEIMKMI